jgi:thiosulfate reductase cytochrome b subunit
MDDLGFPVWLRLNHFVNLLFLSLLIRSGIQILADKPKLFWSDNCKAGTEWFTFNLKTTDSVSSILALPGGSARSSLELGRTWHALSVLFWVANGIIYVALLFLTNEWHRLLPQSIDIFPEAMKVLGQYLTFSPQESTTGGYNALQKLAYSTIIFVCAPLSMLTGVAISPKVNNRFPFYPRLFGGRQIARSLHYLLLLGYLGFTVVHVSLVLVTGLARHMNHIVLGAESDSFEGIFWAALALALVVTIHYAVTRWSLVKPEQVENSLAAPKVMLFSAPEELAVERGEESNMHLSDDELREKIRKMLVDDKLETMISPFPEDNAQFDAIIMQLRALDKDDLAQKLIISGFYPEPIEEQSCKECIYYLVHRKWCDIPELELPVEPEWWCRLWRI